MRGWPKPARTSSRKSSRCSGGTSGSASGSSLMTADSTLGPWVERAGRDQPDDPRSGGRLHGDRQIRKVTGRRRDPLGDLALDHQHQHRRGRLDAQVTEQERRRDLVRQVCDELVRRSQIVGRIELQRVALDDLDVLWHQARQHGRQVAVQLERDDPPRPPRQLLGQDAEARPDFEHLVVGRQRGGRRDLARDPDVGQERLREPSARLEAKLAQQRRRRRRRPEQRGPGRDGLRTSAGAMGRSWPVGLRVIRGADHERRNRKRRGQKLPRRL